MEQFPTAVNEGVSQGRYNESLIEKSLEMHFGYVKILIFKLRSDFLGGILTRIFSEGSKCPERYLISKRIPKRVSKTPARSNKNGW